MSSTPPPRAARATAEKSSDHIHPEGVCRVRVIIPACARLRQEAADQAALIAASDDPYAAAAEFPFDWEEVRGTFCSRFLFLRGELCSALLAAVRARCSALLAIQLGLTACGWLQLYTCNTTGKTDQPYSIACLLSAACFAVGRLGPRSGPGEVVVGVRTQHAAGVQVHADTMCITCARRTRFTFPHA